MRNFLAHLKLHNNLNIDDATFNGYWKDITDLVDAIQGLGRPYFTQQTAQTLQKKLKEVMISMTFLKYGGNFVFCISCGRLVKKRRIQFCHIITKGCYGRF